MHLVVEKAARKASQRVVMMAAQMVARLAVPMAAAKVQWKALLLVAVKELQLVEWLVENLVASSVG